MANELRLAIESIAGLRPYQEDSVLAETLADGRTLVAVADGMGGHAAGEVASALALETLVDSVKQGLDLRQAFRLANEKVHRRASEPGKQGMGTTLVAALVDGQHFTVANVGDSRAYLVSAKGIEQLTQDHSFVAEAMKRGQSEAEAMATPWKDALTRSVGTDEEVEVDVFGPLPLADDCALLICSDGLYKTLSANVLRDLFVQSSSARGAAQSLVATALDRGSDDNISVAIAEYGEVPRDAAPTTMVLAYDPEAAPEPEPESANVEPAIVAGDGVEEGALVTGLPLAALIAIVLVVGVVVAILIFAG